MVVATGISLSSAAHNLVMLDICTRICKAATRQEQSGQRECDALDDTDAWAATSVQRPELSVRELDRYTTASTSAPLRSTVISIRLPMASANASSQ